MSCKTQNIEYRVFCNSVDHINSVGLMVYRLGLSYKDYWVWTQPFKIGLLDFTEPCLNPPLFFFLNGALTGLILPENNTSKYIKAHRPQNKDANANLYETK